MLKSIKILLVKATYYDYEISQMNVKIIFLYGIIQDVYRTPLKSSESKEFANKICKP